MFFPVWNDCSLCGYLSSCSDPFSPTGVCPHPHKAAQASVQPHSVVKAFDLPPDYRAALETDPHFASIHERAKRGIRITRRDFFYLQEQAYQSQNPASPPVQLLWNILEELLLQLRQDFISYYGLEAGKVDAATVSIFFWAISLTTPHNLASSEAVGLDWGSHLHELIRQRLWIDLVRQYFPTEELNDEYFRIFFEKAWADLMRYRGVKFDFRIVPGLSPLDFVRYQKLPRGDKAIRRMVSTYIVHQATTYPHLNDPLRPNLVQNAYLGRLREMYMPLVRAVTRQVLAELEATPDAAPQLELAVAQQVWESYEEAVRNFRFHVPYSGRPSPLGLLGVLGLAESLEERASFDLFLRNGGAAALGLEKAGEQTELRSTDFTPIVFSLYVRERLRAWRLKYYPPLPQEVPTISLDQPAFAREDATSMSSLGDTLSNTQGWGINEGVTPAVISPDGLAYLTVEQAARRYGATVEQLRYLDEQGRYCPPRAGVVLGAEQLPRAMRLYPLSDEAHQAVTLALLRTQTRSASLNGRELTRHQVASLIGVPTSTLRAWERAGKLVPEKRGRAIVYMEATVALAQRLKDQQKAQP